VAFSSRPARTGRDAVALNSLNRSPTKTARLVDLSRSVGLRVDSIDPLRSDMSVATCFDPRQSTRRFRDAIHV